MASGYAATEASGSSKRPAQASRASYGREHPYGVILCLGLPQINILDLHNIEPLLMRRHAHKAGGTPIQELGNFSGNAAADAYDVNGGI